MPTQQKGRPPTMADVLDAHLKAKKKRYTPGRMAYRYVLKRARNKRARRDLLNSLMILGFAACVAVFIWGSQVAAAAGVLVLVLLVCEAWREIARWLYLNRRMQLPFVALGAMAAPAWLGLHQPSAALGLGLIAAAGAVYATFNLRARNKLYSDARGYVPRQWLPMFYLASYWTIAVPLVGITREVLGGLLIGWVFWAGWFWFENRERETRDLPIVKLWNETFNNPDSELQPADRLLGSKLVNVRKIHGGYLATVILPAHVRGSKLEKLTELIAQVYDVPVTAVSIDSSTSSRRRELMIMPDAAINKVVPWKGMDLDFTTWVSTVGTYLDGQRVKYVWCRSGPWHDLICGAQGTGKSRLIDLLLTAERLSGGYMVSWVIDPQMGQSLPDWVEREVDWFALGVAEGKRMLIAARQVMYRRNAILAVAERPPGEQRPGRKTRRGLKNFTPTLEMPLLVITIDEAHMLLADPECVAIVEEMSKMTRKTGIKFRLVTHVARVDQLGGSPVLRSMVVAGNVFIFRTGAQSDAGFATQGAMRVEANQIPKEFPNGEPTFGLGYTMGAISRPVTMRTDYVEDPFDYIDEDNDPVWALDGASLQDVYDIYRMRWHDDFGAGDVVQGEVVDEHDTPVEPATPVEPEAMPDTDSYGREYTCQRALIDYLRANAATKNRPISVTALRQHLLDQKKWGSRNINAVIKEAVDDLRSPVDSDDGRATIYLKETARTGT